MTKTKAPKRTKIVCTMGPATEDDAVLRALIESGMNVARFNFSHGSHDYHRKNIERVRSVAAELGRHVAIMLDTKGPEVRTRQNLNGTPFMIERNTEILVSAENKPSEPGHIRLDYLDIADEVEPEMTILIDDGLIDLTVLKREGDALRCFVIAGGELGEHKGVNTPDVNLKLPSVTEQDRADIMFGCEMGIDAIAASFVRDAAGVQAIRDICDSMDARNIMVLPKIESAIAVRNFDEILAAADGIMIARGDLGVEVAAPEVPHIQKTIIRKCNEAYKPVITATQMLDSMIRHLRPTRAEVTDVANAIYDGTDCVMLSGETAAGKYPIEAVQTMAAICTETELYLDERHAYSERDGVRNVNGALGYAAVKTCNRVGARCILAPTNSGRTARLISAFRPKLPVYAFSPSEATLRRCCFYWGVDAYLSTLQPSLTATVKNALALSLEHGLVEKDDLVMVTAGDPSTSPSKDDYVSSTNMIMVAQV